MEEIAFKYAVDHINRNRELLPRSRVMAQIERVPPHDSFYASKRGTVANSGKILWKNSIQVMRKVYLV